MNDHTALRTVAPPHSREHTVANFTVAQESMSSFGLRLCGLRAIKVKGFFCPSKESLVRVRIFLTTIIGGSKMILHFSAHLCARGVRGTRNRIVLRAGAIKAISGMALAGILRASAPAAAARVELYRSIRRRTPFCLLGSRTLSYPPPGIRGCAGARNRRQVIHRALAGHSARA